MVGIVRLVSVFLYACVFLVPVRRPQGHLYFFNMPSRVKGADRSTESVPPLHAEFGVRPLLVLGDGEARDDHALDLRGALVDLEDLGVAHQLLHRVLGVEAVAAKDLNSVRGALVGDVAGKRLGDGRVVGVLAALQIRPRKDEGRVAM